MPCRSCGMEGIEGTCSMCYGDPYHNTDGEYLRQLEEQQRQEMEREEERISEERENYDSKRRNAG